MENINTESKREIMLQIRDDLSLNQLKMSSPSSRMPRDKRRSQYKEPKNVNKNREKKKRKKEEDKSILKKLITKNKVEVLKKNFVNKLRLNSTHRSPVEELETIGDEEDEVEQSMEFVEKLKEINGIKIGNAGQTIWAIVNMINSFMMFAIFSIMMAFPSTHKSSFLFYLRIFNLFVYFCDMVLNSTVQRYEKGNFLSNIKQISAYYIKNHLPIDLISIGILLLDLLLSFNISVLSVIVSLVRLMIVKKKFEKLEYLYITSSETEQYYGLVKVFLMNFVIGHVLSILLNLMAGTGGPNTWWAKINIQAEDWYVKYIWGYYWGTNIMLTVGFGDLAANNYYEAIILIFIETFSCITLAYNISYVGALMSSIREKEEEKRKKLQYFHKMCKENEVPREMEYKITNFLEESYEIKDAFCYDQYDEVLESLPKSMQLEFRKQSNKAMFDGLGFLNNLSLKTLLKMAELVERKIAHPNETLLKKGEKSEFMILQKGKLCFCCKPHRAPDSKLEGKVMDVVEVKNEKAKLVSLDFIRNKELQYNMKSDSYSVLYTLPIETFKESLKSSEMDYQLYCVLRDRDQYIIDEQNLYLCEVCKSKYHNRFQCSKMHYCPLKRMVIAKYLEKTKHRNCIRSKFARERMIIPPLLNKYETRQDRDRFLEEYIKEEFLKTIKSEKNSQPKSQTSTASMVSEEKYESRKNATLKKSAPLKKVLSRMNTQRKFSDHSAHFPRKSILEDMFEKVVNLNMMENNFWDLECDQAFNYRYYFESHNSNRFKEEDQIVKLKTMFEQ